MKSVSGKEFCKLLLIVLFYETNMLDPDFAARWF